MVELRVASLGATKRTLAQTCVVAPYVTFGRGGPLNSATDKR